MIVFAISIAFQLAGAILLIDNFIPTRKAILKRSFSQTGNVIMGDFVHSDRNIMTKDRLQRNAKYIYQNFGAIVLICAGYILTPFGYNDNPLIETIIILPTVILLNVVGREIVSHLVVKNYTKNAIVDKEGNEIKGSEEDKILQGQ